MGDQAGLLLLSSPLGRPSGKRQRQSLDEAGPPPHRPYIISSVDASSPKTFYVNDSRMGRKFLVDSGAAVCVFPASPEDLRRGTVSTSTLAAANGSTIRSFGKRIIPLALGKNGQLFTQELFLADVTYPIIGADFFHHHRIGIDLWRRRLVNLDKSDWAWCGGVAEGGSENILCSVDSAFSSSFHDILNEYPDIKSSNFHSSINKHGIEKVLADMKRRGVKV